MPVRFPGELPLEPMTDSTARGLSGLRHGELLTGKVTRVDADGRAAVRFADFEVQTRANSLLQAGTRVFAHVQKNRDETLLTLLPNTREGDILTGDLVSSRSSESLARFGESELRVRLPSSEAALPEGASVRAQVQVSAGRPVLQALPGGASQTVVSGTVVSVREDGSILLDVEGTALIANGAEGLKAGDSVQAAVREADGKLLLQVLPQTPSSEQAAPALGGEIGELLGKFLAMPQYARLLEAFLSGELKLDGAGRDLLLLLQQLAGGTEADRAEWASTLARTLETILLNPQGEGFTGQVGDAITNSGIFLESRLAQAALSQELDPAISGDLKLALLLADQKLSQMLQAAGAKGTELPPHLAEIAAKVGQLLDAVTAGQFLNVRMLPSQQIYIQLPFSGGAELDRVEIRISPREKGGSRKIDPRNVLLTLAVTTSKLGRIKAALSIIDGQISCQFKASRESVVELLTSNADALRSGLEKLHYRVAHIGCTMSGDERDLSLFDEPAAFPQEGLDVRI